MSSIKSHSKSEKKSHNKATSAKRSRFDLAAVLANIDNNVSALDITYPVESSSEEYSCSESDSCKRFPNNTLFIW